MSSPAIVLAGPTASGKSAIAVELALAIGGEIVNADAFQIYDTLPILTAQPGVEEQGRAPHHLYGAISPLSEITAAEYARKAEVVISEIVGRGRIPIICGGTGLYIKSLTHGLDEVPAADPALRARLEARPLPELVAELCVRDPGATTQIDLQNPRRVIRALEIAILAGRPATELRQAWSKPPAAHFRGFYLQLDRAILWDRIETRTRQMFEHGVVEEVAAAGELGPGASRAIGYREIQRYLGGKLSLEECRTRIIELTRQYAKRQETWFRKETWMRRIVSGADIDNS